MKNLLIFIILVCGVVAQEQPWELKPSIANDEEKRLKSEFLKLQALVADDALSQDNLSNENRKLIRKLYENTGSSKFSTDIKSYAFAALARTEDVEAWGKEIPKLLSSNSRQLIGSAVDVVYYTFRNGNNREKEFLFQDSSVMIELEKVASSMNDGNFKVKIDKIYSLLDDFKNSSIKDRSQKKDLSIRNEDKNSSKGISHGSNKKSKNQEEIAEAKKSPSRFPWIIAGVLLLGILALLFKVIKGKSTS